MLLTSATRSRGFTASYLKMDSETLKDPVKHTQIREAWESGWALSPNPIAAWEIAWGRTLEVFQKLRSEEQSVRSKLQKNQEKLEELRISLAEGHEGADLNQYRELEQWVHQENRKDSGAATNARTQGDSRRNGKGKGAGRRRSYSRSSYSVVGMDGPGVSSSAARFWRGKSLGKKSVTAVVKLLPKSEEKQFLRNWRPISLLPIIYKIAARILSTRIKRLISTLVDEEQAGFVDGRFITYNVLCLRLSQELAEERKHPSIFCKLDFSKAFDHVQHEFLWATLRMMNFCAEFISLVQGLVAQGSAKVFLNRTATESFQLRRGVR
ncbi:hypothetical protein R1sor_024978 [Riccia sorocarpa]|uniref:Reverse transcriptase domain-containing protein n=1 Tax=Riccia sorocarpa TaxID=122646 RepID=A0ABD3G788_9MARC